MNGSRKYFQQRCCRGRKPLLIFISSVHFVKGRFHQQHNDQVKIRLHTCSMTSGAIQQGVPTKVCRTFSRDKSLPADSHALTPKSAIITLPSSPRRMLPAFMSLQHKTTIQLWLGSRPTCWPAKPKPSYAQAKHGHKLLNGGQATKRRN